MGRVKEFFKEGEIKVIITPATNKKQASNQSEKHTMFQSIFVSAL